MNLTVNAQQKPQIMYTQKDGLLSNNVYGVVQDNKGFIWITTDVGISKFDGRSFTHFTVLDGLPTNFNWRLFYDSQDRIWLFNNITPLTYIKNDSIFRIGEKRTKFYIKNIVEDEKGNIHFNQDFNKGSGRIVITKNNQIINESKSWYLGTVDQKEYYLEKQRLIIKSLTKPKTEVIDNSLFLAHHYVLTNNYLYLVAYKKIVSFNLKTKTVSVLKELKDDNHFITANLFHNKALIGQKKGFFYIKNNQIEQADTSLFISHILVDKNKNIWLPTLGNGLIFYPNLDKQVTNFADENMRDVFVDRADSTVYFSNGYSEFYQIKNNQKLLIDNLNEINALSHIIKHKDFFLLFKSNRLLIYNQNKKFQNPEIISSNDTTLVLNKKYEFYTCNGTRDYNIENDSILLGTTHGLVLLSFNLDKNTLTIKRLTLKRVLSSHLHRSIIIFGNEFGLFKFLNGKERQLFKNEISGGSVKSIIFNPKLNAYFVGTEQGYLYQLSADLKSIVKIDILFNQIKDISIKDSTTLLVSTSNKLVEFNVLTQSITNSIGVSDGLLSNHILKATYFDSTYYIATALGLSILKNKKDILEENKQYPTYIKAIYVDNKPIAIDTNLITIPTNSNALKIEFTNLTYWGNKNLIYTYKIDNNQWVSISTSIIEFADFPYGKHTFYLKTIGYNGIERPNVVELKLYKAYPFWLRPWFIFLLVVGCILIVVFIMRYIYIRKAKNEQIKQEQLLLENKTALAEYKALRLQMNPHFLFNSLNAVQNSILDGDVENANLYLNDFATLMRQILQYSTKESIKLSEELKLSEHYFKIEKNRFKGNIDFKIEVDDQINVETVYVPPMIFQPIIENAIWHGIVPLNKDGEINLKVELEDSYLKVTITDNGVGYEQSILKPKKHKKRDSIAIKNTCDRLKYFDKSKQLKDKYIKIENNDKQGTKVVLFIYIKPRKDV